MAARRGELVFRREVHMRMNKYAAAGMALLIVTAALATKASKASHLATHEKTTGAMAFEQLRSLVGEWDGKASGRTVKVTYTLVSGETALMERLQPENEPEMITMYSADGDKILVTHYCSGGNQPSMKTESLKGAANKYSFNLISVSGMKSPDEGHMVALVLTLVDRDHLTQEWRYLDKGKTNAEIMEFKRRPEKAAIVVPIGN